MKGLTGTVKLPLGLAGNSGLAKDAFKNSTNTNLNTIEFVFTTPNGQDLTDATVTKVNSPSSTPGGNLFKDNLKKVYEMFAAESESTFATSTNLTAANNWLPKAPSPTGGSGAQDATESPATPTTANFNGITWTLTTPTTSGSGGKAGSAIDSNTQKVEITGQIASTGQALKYKYTNPNGTLSSGTHTLPSNIKTIKITLNKGASPQVKIAGK